MNHSRRSIFGLPVAAGLSTPNAQTDMAARIEAKLGADMPRIIASVAAAAEKLRVEMSESALEFAENADALERRAKQIRANIAKFDLERAP